MIILVILFRYLWQYYPSLWACLLFWTSVGIGEYLYLRGRDKVNWWFKIPLLMGGSMNAIVTIANDGRMPFLGHTKPTSLWVVGTGRHLLFLCDRFDTHWAIFSLGDFFIIGGLFLSLFFWLFRSEKPLKTRNF